MQSTPALGPRFAGHARRHAIVKRQHEFDVLSALLDAGPLTRAELSRATGLSKPTVGAIVQRLIDTGIVRQVEDSGSSLAKRVRLGDGAGVACGLSIGAQTVRAGIIDLSGAGTRLSAEVPTPGAWNELREVIQTLLDEVCADGAVPRDAIKQATVAVAGVPRGGGIHLAPDTPSIAAVDLERELGRTIGCDVSVQNDVNLAAIAEGWRGAAIGCSNYAYLYFGKGVGMGLVINGQLVPGSHGAAGEVGYLPIGRSPFDPDLRGRGALESHSLLSENPGDRSSDSAVGQIADLVASTVVAVQSVVDLEVVAVSGRLVSSDQVLTAVRERVESTPVSTAVVRSNLGSDGLVLGALATARSTLIDRLLPSPQDLPDRRDSETS